MVYPINSHYGLGSEQPNKKQKSVNPQGSGRYRVQSSRGSDDAVTPADQGASHKREFIDKQIKGLVSGSAND